ncbi:MAG: hypothetical protein IKC11_03005 [Clostridia bacterium]|nr:hypothetical protein [Clostridia bacterium]
MIISSFFNSENGDRLYNADDLARRFKLFFTNGVFMNRSNALQVVSNEGLSVNILTGACNIEGYSGEVTSAENIEIPTPDSLYSRIDAICICLDLLEREIRAEIIKGTPSAIPSAPYIVESDVKKYLCLAYVTVGPQVQSIYQADISDKRLDTALCGIVTQAVQSMDTSSFYAQMESSLVNFLNTSELTFSNWFASIKTQLESVDVAILQADILELQTEQNRQLNYIYRTGQGNDNRNISNLVNNFLQESEDDEMMLTLSVQGDYFREGAVLSASGSFPTSFMRFATEIATNRRVIIDFTNCPKLTSYYPIYANSNITIKGLRFTTYEGSCLLSYGARIEKCLLSGGQNGITGTLVYAKDCKIEAKGLDTLQNAYGVNCGGFLENCDIVATSESTSGKGNTNGAFGIRIDHIYPMTVIGGSARAYIKSSATTSEAVGLYVLGSLTEAVVNAYGVRFPQVAKGGYTQTNAVKINSGYGSIIGCMSYKENAIYNATNIFTGGNCEVNKTYGLS